MLQGTKPYAVCSNLGKRRRLRLWTRQGAGGVWEALGQKQPHFPVGQHRGVERRRQDIVRPPQKSSNTACNSNPESSGKLLLYRFHKNSRFCGNDKMKNS